MEITHYANYSNTFARWRHLLVYMVG